MDAPRRKRPPSTPSALALAVHAPPRPLRADRGSRAALPTVAALLAISGLLACGRDRAPPIEADRAHDGGVVSLPGSHSIGPVQDQVESVGDRPGTKVTKPSEEPALLGGAPPPVVLAVPSASAKPHPRPPTIRGRAKVIEPRKAPPDFAGAPVMVKPDL
jgi:hypothetical protein